MWRLRPIASLRSLATARRRRLRRGSCERLPLLVIVSVVLEESAELIGDVVKRSDGYVRYTKTDMEARCEIQRVRL